MNAEQFRNFSVPLCRAHKAFNKVFGIGANKTGTTSLQQIFFLLGLDVAPQAEGELCGVQSYFGHFEDLRRYIDRHDAFQDAPFAVKSTYALVDALFPNSKFILTVRDPDDWFNSMLNFHKKIMGSSPDQRCPTKDQVARFPYLFDGYVKFLIENDWILAVDADYRLSVDWNLAYNRDHYIRAYEERNRAIVRHFSTRPDHLLVVDLTQEADTTKIVDFLGLPTQLASTMPHANKT
jgi:hypothetical protein